VTVYSGAIQAMPGLPAVSAATRIELAPDGTITGLS
jgi:formyltetrahydrofolate synthetase